VYKRQVKELNKALLITYYNIQYWDIPDGFLCPPIPGRADYIHHIADLLGAQNKGKLPQGSQIKCLDIGVGANCIYPIIGNCLYGWSFVGSDINKIAINCAQNIIDKNDSLKGQILLKHQQNTSQIFKNIIAPKEFFDVTICNPPFHESEKEALKGTLRKMTNLKKRKVKNAELNFGGKEGELWTDGGERQFVIKTIKESVLFSKNCAWFTTLVSKQSNLDFFYHSLKNYNVVKSKTIAMGQGNKKSRILAWTFMNNQELEHWANKRWL